MADAIVVLNAGSSSIKFSLFTVARTTSPRPDLRGQIEGLHTASALRRRRTPRASRASREVLGRGRRWAMRARSST
jgi:acetate kinase